MKKSVFKGTDTVLSILVKQDGVPLDFSSETRMVLSFYGTDVVADSSVSASLIDWFSGQTGEIRFNLNGLDIPHGKSHWATLRVYDPVHPDGQVLFAGHGVGRFVQPKENGHLRLLFLDI